MHINADIKLKYLSEFNIEYFACFLNLVRFFEPFRCMSASIRVIKLCAHTQFRCLMHI